MNKPTFPTKSLQIGYCTNVHPSPNFDAILENIRKHCRPICDLVKSQTRLGIGLWFSEQSAHDAIQGARLPELKSILDESGLVPFTLNGFPQGDFHSQVVKHRVYKPTWWQTERRDYTLQLIEILDQLLPAQATGSISTLPIAWNDPAPTRDQLSTASNHLIQVAEALHRLYESTGRTIVLAIEPEPGCYLTDSFSFRVFYDRYLSEPFRSARESELARKYLTLCHDICHAAVMFEDQKKELSELARQSIGVGKVQVSAAIQVPWNSMDAQQRRSAFEQLSGFAEDRYLHQTTWQINGNSTVRLVEDLGLALRETTDAETGKPMWRVHFHVPIFLNNFGLLQSTQSEIETLVQYFESESSNGPSPLFTGHYEVETYAWSVLPSDMRQINLNEGIADEIRWFQTLSGEVKPTHD